MSEITHATSSRSNACETVYASRTIVVCDGHARLRSSSFAAAAFVSTGSPSRSSEGAKAGGARRDRTDDLLLAKQALSQLSYGPLFRARCQQSARPAFAIARRA